MQTTIYAILICWNLQPLTNPRGEACHPENELRFSSAEECDQAFDKYHLPKDRAYNGKQWYLKCAKKTIPVWESSDEDGSFNDRFPK
jgi:hypothetical protein